MAMKWLERIFFGGDYGLSIDNPVRCGDGPPGEKAYLNKLRCPNGQRVNYIRRGSIQGRPGGIYGGIGTHKILDLYDVECQCGGHKINIYMDMYEKRKDHPIGLKGWTLEEPGASFSKGPGRALLNSVKDLPLSDITSELMEEMKKNPEIVRFFEDSFKELGDDPAAKIIRKLAAEGSNRDAQIMAGIMLSYIGEPAIPHLTKLLGDDNHTLAMFAAKTLPMIEGSLPHMKKALQSENPRMRLNAAGSLQFFGPKAVQLIPDLCELIAQEIIEAADTGAEKISEVASIAAGSLGKLGEMALPMLGELLKNDNVNIRLVALSAMLSIGKPALPLLFESKAKEKDKLVLTALEDVIERIEHKEE
jgi:hypothetical protein